MFHHVRRLTALTLLFALSGDGHFLSFSEKPLFLRQTDKQDQKSGDEFS